MNQTPFSNSARGIAPTLAAIGIRMNINVMSFNTHTSFPKIDRNDTSGLIMGYGIYHRRTRCAHKPVGREKANSGRGGLKLGPLQQRQIRTPCSTKIGREADVATRNWFLREALVIQRDDLAVIPLSGEGGVGVGRTSTRRMCRITCRIFTGFG